MSGLVGHRGLLLAASEAVNPTYAWVTSLTNSPSLSDNNATATFSSISAASSFGVRGNVALSGKVYCEFELTSQGSSNNYHGFGVVNSSSAGAPFGANAYNIASRGPNGSAGCGLPSAHFTNSNGTTASAAGAAHNPTDRIGVAFDSATGKLWFRVNGAWISGDPAAGTSPSLTAGAGTYYFAFLDYSCLAAGADPVAKIFPAASMHLHAAPSGFSPYQP